MYHLFLLTIATPLLGWEQNKEEYQKKNLKKIETLAPYLPKGSQDFISKQKENAKDDLQKTIALKKYTALSLKLHQTFYLPSFINAVKLLSPEEKTQILQENTFYFLNPEFKRNKEALVKLFQLLNTIPEAKNLKEDIRITFLEDILTPLPLQRNYQEKLAEQDNCLEALNTLTSPILRAFVRRLVEKNKHAIFFKTQSAHPPMPQICTNLKKQLTNFREEAPTAQAKIAFLNDFDASDVQNKGQLSEEFGALACGDMSMEFFKILFQSTANLREEETIKALENFIWKWLNLHVHSTNELTTFLKALKKNQFSKQVRADTLRNLLPELLKIKSELKVGGALFENILCLPSKTEQKELLAYATLQHTNDNIFSDEFAEIYTQLCKSLELFSEEQKD